MVDLDEDADTPVHSDGEDGEVDQLAPLDDIRPVSVRSDSTIGELMVSIVRVR